MEFIDLDILNDDIFDTINFSDNTFCLHNICDPYGLGPYLKYSDGRDYFNKILTKINYKKFKNIYLIVPDLNVFRNFKLVKDYLYYNGIIDDETYNEKINILLFPWRFLFDYFTDDDFKLKSGVKIENKNHTICLSGGRKVARALFLSQLCNFKHFKYSNLGYDCDEDFDITLAHINSISFHGDSFFKVDFHDGETLICNGDSSLENFSYHVNDFNLDEYILFKTDFHLFDIKNTSEIDFSIPKWKYNFVPTEFLTAQMSFTFETQTLMVTHLTEKTFKNIFYKKPFLTFAAENFYDFLLKYDFKLYDEIFDYSFDGEENYFERFHNVLHQIKIFLSKDEQERHDLVNCASVKEKIEYNYENSRRICDKIYDVNGVVGEIEKNLINNLEKNIENKIVLCEKI